MADVSSAFWIYAESEGGVLRKIQLRPKFSANSQQRGRDIPATVRATYDCDGYLTAIFIEGEIPEHIGAKHAV